MVAPKIRVGTGGDTTGQDRTGDDAPGNLAIDIGLENLARGSAQPGRDQPRRLHPFATHGDYALRGNLAGRQQLADRDDLLIADVPDRAVGPHRVEVMDVCAGQARRMGTLEFNVLHTLDVWHGDSPARCRTEIDRTFGQPGDRPETVREGRRFRVDYDLRIGRQRRRVDRGDEDGTWRTARGRNMAVRPRPERRPQP